VRSPDEAPQGKHAAASIRKGAMQNRRVQGMRASTSI
jgi:hypothetical protein